jgi:Ca2+-binding RTX toxin-like protein
MSGGPDSDTVRYAQRLTGVRVTLDGLANDGAPGENDQAGVATTTSGSDVENVDGGDGNDVIVGTDGPNVLVSRAGSDTITGLGGDDTIDTLDRTGDDTVNAGTGQDYCAVDLTDALTSCETVFSG